MREYKLIHIDGYIYPEMEALNMAGVPSRFCCAGHPGRNMQPYAVFVFSEATIKRLCAAKYMGIYVTLELLVDRGTILVVARGPHCLRVRYCHCRMFKQYLRNVLAIVEEDRQGSQHIVRLISSALAGVS